MEWKLEMKEREDEENNIIIRGLSIGTERKQQKEEIEKFLKEKLQVQVETERV